MSMHVSGIRYATYYRKSNKHNWILSITAFTKQQLCRALYLNQKDFSLYQHSYIIIDPLKSYTLDDLPKNANIIPVRIRLTDPMMIKALDDFFFRGATPVNPPIVGAFTELGLLQKD